jgi:ATP-dependent DNA helicase UvrD/PcrA
MKNDETQCEYEKHSLQRSEYTEAILRSDASKKLILAGPGTGKSFLFQQICKRKLEEGESKILALSFINELVDDLSQDLYDLAEVKTLHSFALSKIPGERNMFFRLGNVIEGDYAVAFGKPIDFNLIFCNLINDEEDLKFYSKRRKYYNFFSPNCSVYTLIKIFEQNEKRIPRYSLILIDEFQDFNRLESRFLSFLSKRNPVIIVGDDDQSLYDFKYAEPADIRKKQKSEDFEAFELPYCSRCTKGIIDAYTKLIDTAQANGYLQDRAPKQYLYFPSEQKDCCSDSHPKIVVKRNVFQNVIAYNIDLELKALFDPRAKHLPTVLIICPLRKQIESVEKGLRARGFKNIDASQRYEPDTIMEGFNLLLKNSACNLAWRILFEAECQRTSKEERFEQVIKESLDSDIPFKDLLTIEERRTIKKVNAALRKIRDGKKIDDETLSEIFAVLGYNPIEIAQSQVRDVLAQKSALKNIYKNTPIKIVTMLGAKGLTRDYSFLVNFDDRFMLDRSDDNLMKITDGGICKFLVALTRAEERVCIYTSKDVYPTYVEWIADEFIDDRTGE